MEDLEGTETTELVEEGVTVPAVEEPETGLRLRRAAGGRLVAQLLDREVAVTLRQCFPWSEPQRFLSLRDEEEEEVALIEDPRHLDVSSRAAIEESLVEAGFVLEITHVREIEEEIEIRNWNVETKQGKRTFQTHLDDWPRILPNGGLLIRDVGGDLYLLADPNNTDDKTRALLWAYVDLGYLFLGGGFGPPMPVRAPRPNVRHPIPDGTVASVAVTTLSDGPK